MAGYLIDPSSFLEAIYGDLPGLCKPQLRITYGTYRISLSNFRHDPARRNFSRAVTNLRISSFQPQLLTQPPPSLRPLLLLLLRARHTKPKPQYNSEKRKNNRLKDFNVLSLGDSADGEGEECGTAAAEGGREPDCAHVQVAGQQLRHDHHCRREQGAQEQAHEPYCHR